MFGSVADGVQEATNKKQIPWISSPLGGKDYFFKAE